MKKGWMPRGFLLLAALVLAAAVLFGCAAQKGAQYSYSGADSSPEAPAENAGSVVDVGSQEGGIAGMGAGSASQKLIHLYRRDGDRERAV